VDRIKKLARKPPEPALSRPGVRLPDDNSVERASRLFKAIGEAPRLRLLTLLARGEVSVTELAEAEGESLSTISQRLRVLRNENIVLGRRQGKQVNYALADQHILDLVFNALAHVSEVPVQAGARSERKFRTRRSVPHAGSVPV